MKTIIGICIFTGILFGEKVTYESLRKEYPKVNERVDLWGIAPETIKSQLEKEKKGEEKPPITPSEKLELRELQLQYYQATVNALQLELQRQEVQGKFTLAAETVAKEKCASKQLDITTLTCVKTPEIRKNNSIPFRPEDMPNVK